MKQIILTSITVLLILFAGFVGITFYFSDYGPGETALSRQTIALAYYFICGLLVTWISYPKKRTAYFLLWGVIIVAFLNFPQALKESWRSLWQIPVMVFIPFLGVYVSQISFYLIRKKR